MTLTYVIGHKNPDIDSIASAAAYAFLKKSTGEEVIAAVAGIPSKRAEYLFNRYNYPMPMVLTDIYPRVSHIMKDKYSYIQENQTILEAMRLLQKERLRQLPVINKDNTFTGLINLFDLSQRLFSTLSSNGESGGNVMSRTVQTSLSLAASSVEGTILSPDNLEEVREFEVYVGAMSRDSMVSRMENWNLSQSILVLGDRVHMQRIAIEKCIGMLVITGNMAVADELVDLAKEKGTAVIQTSLDSATTVRRLKFSTPVQLLTQTDDEVFHYNDRLCDIRHKINRSLNDRFPVVDSSQKLLGVFSKQEYESEPPINLILVDHNEMNQAVDGASEVPIVEVVDHHRIAMAPTSRPIKITADVVGSTCTLVAQEFKKRALVPNPDIAGILLGGLIMDTLHCASPTTTENDRETLTWLSECAHTDSQELYREIFSVGSIVATSEPHEVLHSDMKFYETGSQSFTVSQVEEVGFENFYDRRIELEQALHSYCEEKGHSISALFITNVATKDSLLLVSGDVALIDMLPWARIDDTLLDLSGILSRKKELLPVLLKITS